MTRRQPLVVVELVRFLCAAAVLGGHYLVSFWRAPSLQQHDILAGLPGPPWSITANYGWLGVELFFVISGLMIARSADVPSTVFARRRLLRLIPTVVVCATLSFAILGLGSDIDRASLAGRWARSVAFVPAGDAIDSVYWTLGIEVNFYILIGWALHRGATPAQIGSLGYALAAISLVYWLVCRGAGLDPIHLNRGAQLLLLPHGCFFALGMAIAGWQQGRRSALLAAATLAALSTAVIAVDFHAQVSEAETGLAIDHHVAILLFATGTALLALAQRLHCGMAWLGAGRMRTIGLMTFPLYLLHQDAGAVLIGAAVRHGTPHVAATAAVTALMVATAWSIVRWVESPARQRLARLLRWQPTPDIAAPLASGVSA